MFKQDYAIYLGKEDESYLVEFVALQGFYLVIELPDSVKKDDFEDVIDKIKNKINNEPPDNLKSFSDFINSHIESLQEKGAVSLACGYVVNDVLYLKTEGGGQIYLQRADKLQKIIEDKNTASGFIKEGDSLVFTTARFIRLLNGVDLASKMSGLSVKEIVERITPKLKGKDDVGAIALFLKFEKKEITEDKQVVSQQQTNSDFGSVAKTAEDVQEIKSTRLIKLITMGKNRINHFSRTTSTGRRLTFAVAVVLIIILIWSIFTGAQRRQQDKLQKQVEAKIGVIENFLQDAQDASILDRSQAMIFIMRAKDELAQLQEIVGEKKFAQIDSTAKNVSRIEKSITRKEEKKYEEFYNFGLINEKAQADAFFISADNLVVLDSKAGSIYRISLEKKSVDTIKNSAIRGADKVAAYREIILFLDFDKGMYKIEANKNIKKVIDSKDQWNNPVDFWIYNGNLYVLDSGSDEVYKHLVTESGYSSKSSYFKPGNAKDLQKAVSLSIDGALYIATQNNIYKYLSGIDQGFSVDLPEKEGVEFHDIFTNENTNKLYVLDKKQGVVYVLNKNGEYEKQINSAIFKKALGIIAYEQKQQILVLVETGIYSVSTE